MDLRILLCAGAAFAGAWLSSAPSVWAQSGGGYDLTWSSLDCGTPSTSTGGSYALGGIIGQPDAGRMTGGVYELQGGFPRGSIAATDAPPDVTEDSGPLVFRLHANVPNPFNSATTIAFTLADDENVKLQIYDLAGRLVRTVMSRSLQAGRHQVTWDARDEAGRRVAHGIYVLRLEAGAFQARRKLALVP